MNTFAKINVKYNSSQQEVYYSYIRIVCICIREPSSVQIFQDCRFIAVELLLERKQTKKASDQSKSAIQ